MKSNIPLTEPNQYIVDKNKSFIKSMLRILAISSLRRRVWWFVVLTFTAMTLLFVPDRSSKRVGNAYIIYIIINLHGLNSNGI